MDRRPERVRDELIQTFDDFEQDAVAGAAVLARLHREGAEPVRSGLRTDGGASRTLGRRMVNRAHPVNKTC
jgi:hypothetical protein